MAREIGNVQSTVERLKLEIAEKKVRLAGEFLSDHFSHRRIYELEEETERLRRMFPIWKAQKAGSLFHDNVGVAVVRELSFKDLVETASFMSNYWGARARKADSQDESIPVVRNSRLWEYFHAITVEAVEIEEREKGKKYDTTKLIAYSPSVSEGIESDGVDTAESVDRFLRRQSKI